jgi:threonine/homoserine/homoserine lactone efflux protein
MVLNLFLKGWIIGFSVAMPVGPIAMLCIRHSLIRGAAYGLIAGLGAALADTFYGILAGFGMTLVCEFLSKHQLSCHLLGALVLCCLGLSTLKKKPKAKAEEKKEVISYKRVFFTTFFLTLTNPLTILGFLGVYAALGIGFMDEMFWSAGLLTAGIFIGSTTWWSLLSFSSSHAGKKLNFQSTSLLNKISGSTFLAFGLFTALAALRQLELFNF